MKRNKIPGLLLVLLCIPALSAVELLSTSDVTLKLNSDFSETIAWSLEKGRVKLEAPHLDLSWEVDSGKWELSSSLDLAPLYTNNLDAVLQDLYLKYALGKDLELKVGQFKLPLGMEYHLGRSTRPYLGHSKSSRELLPGYDRGVGLKFNNLFSFLDIDTGLYNGVSIRKASGSLTNLLPAVRFKAQLEPGNLLKLEVAYSLGSPLGLSQVFHYKIYQGLGVQTELNFGKNNDLILFAEFLEKFTNSLAYNNKPAWSHGIFTFLAYRLGMLEPYATYEHYKADVAVSTIKDKMYVSGGINLHLPADAELNTNYRWEYTYLGGLSEQSVQLSFTYQL